MDRARSLVWSTTTSLLLQTQSSSLPIFRWGCNLTHNTHHILLVRGDSNCLNRQHKNLIHDQPLVGLKPMPATGANTDSAVSSNDTQPLPYKISLFVYFRANLMCSISTRRWWLWKIDLWKILFLKRWLPPAFHQLFPYLIHFAVSLYWKVYRRTKKYMNTIQDSIS